MELFHILLLLLFLLSNCVISSPAQSPAPIINHARDDELTLLAFKSVIGIGDPFGRLGQWNESLHFCRWPGITCGGRRHPDRVRALDLSSMNLTGPIPRCLSNLTFLRRLSLDDNQFYGHIPWEFGHLSQLRHLSLSVNSLGGNIPATLSHCSRLQNVSLRNNMLQGMIPFGLGLGLVLGNCSELQYISLGNNKLQGDVPSNLSRFSKLQYINLANNMLTGGIPPSLGNLSSLRLLSLSGNSLSGGIPQSFGKLTSLTFLNLADNNLSGVIPISIYNISSIDTLSLSANMLHGTLPKDIGYTLPRLQKLVMYGNRLHGPLPASLANASQLEWIELDTNRFSGTIPGNLAALQSLTFLYLYSNQLEGREAKDWIFLHVITNSSSLQELDVAHNLLGGTLPAKFVTNSNSTSLNWLALDDNQISGIIPSWIWNLQSLGILFLGKNTLVGRIPADIGNLQRLYELNVEDNHLSGELPPTLGNLTQLNLLYMENNYLNGSIPTSIENCQQLKLLNLSRNHLTGPIPKAVLGISSLSIYLDLSHNSLTGALPSQVGSLKNLEGFYVSNNKLSGEIPSALGQCQSLEFLYMDGNFLHGNIPQSLSNLKGIQQIDLSRNNLSGPIPEFLEGLRALNYLNLSFNYFDGRVAEDGVFGNASGISVLGNNKLCGGIPQLHLPSCSIQKSHRSHLLRLILPLAAVILCVILLSICLATGYWLCKSSRKSLAVTASEKDHHLMKVSYQELLKATNGFSPTNLIGVGSFGSVYKGILCDEQKVVAVKVLNLQRQGALKNFAAECEALRNIRHRNLVRIITSCSSIDFSGNEFRALIFEFMSNGSLDMWLHPEENGQHELRSLSLIQRLNIAKDVATAIDYLHHHGNIPVVHCDLKPSNILLDDEMVARVGDFGLARLLLETTTTAPHSETSSSTLKGSIGYMAPEYGMANKVSTQGDVYSYGILLLETFTGKRPTDDIFKKGLCLRQYVVASYSEKLMHIVDPCLFKYEEVGDTSGNITRRKLIDCITSILAIGLCCTEESPSDRINMGDVTKKVQLVIDRFFRI